MEFLFIQRGAQLCKRNSIHIDVSENTSKFSRFSSSFLKISLIIGRIFFLQLIASLVLNISYRTKLCTPYCHFIASYYVGKLFLFRGKILQIINFAAIWFTKKRKPHSPSPPNDSFPPPTVHGHLLLTHMGCLYFSTVSHSYIFTFHSPVFFLFFSSISRSLFFSFVILCVSPPLPV